MSQYEIQRCYLPAMTLAVMTHQGHPSGLMQTVAEFRAWRQQLKLSPQSHRTFNFIYDDPTITPPERFRLDLAVEVAENFELPPNEQRLTLQRIPKLDCISATITGDEQLLNRAISYVFNQYLPKQPLTLQPFPLVIERVKFGDTLHTTEAINRFYIAVTDKSN